MDDVLMRIGEIAAIFNVSVKAMRIYERMGILKPVKVDEQTGYRYYSADQVKALNVLLDLKGLGFSLAEIKDLLENGIANEKYMELLTHKRVMWQDKIALAQGKIDGIDEIIAELENAQPATKLHELTEDERAQLLSRLACIEEVHGRNMLTEVLWL